MKKLIIGLIVIVSVICCFCLSASAVTIDRNEFVDYDQFATYSVNKEAGIITADLSLPDNWFWTRYRDSHNYEYLFNGLSFSFDEPVNGTSRLFDLTFNPFFKNFNYTARPDYFITNAIFFDLTYVPLNATLTFGIEYHLSDDELDIDRSHVCNIIFVNKDGYVVSSEPMELTIHQAYLGGDVYSFGLDAEYTFTSIPFEARGFYYIFNSNFSNLDSSPISVNITKNNLSFALSNFELDLNNNKIIRNGLSNIQNQLGDIINRPLNPGTPPGQSDFDDLHDNEQELLGQSKNYLDNGLSFFQNASGVILGLSNGFEALKVLVQPVFALPFSNKLITVSISLGLIAALIGVAIAFNSKGKGGKE